MITTLEKKFFPVVNGEYTRITAEDFSALAGVFVKKKAKSLGVELEA